MSPARQSEDKQHIYKAEVFNFISISCTMNENAKRLWKFSKWRQNLGGGEGWSNFTHI